MEPNRLDKVKWLETWAEVWADLTEVFSHSKPSDRAYDLYADRLADIPAARLRAAAEQCMATCRHLPTIAELREAAGAVAADREPIAVDLYGQTVRELSAALAEQRIPNLDPIAKEVVKGLGGAWALIYSTNPETTRAHFLHAYNEKLGQERTISNVVPMARRLAPGPAPREIAAPEPKQLPAPPVEPLTREEAARLITQAHARQVEAGLVRRMPAIPAEAVSEETITFERCNRCGLELDPTLLADGCPRCRLYDQIAAEAAGLGEPSLDDAIEQGAAPTEADDDLDDWF